MLEQDELDVEQLIAANEVSVTQIDVVLSYFRQEQEAGRDQFGNTVLVSELENWQDICRAALGDQDALRRVRERLEAAGD